MLLAKALMTNIDNDNIYYSKKDYCLLLGDCIELLTKFDSQCIDMIFADPPYFLSSGGITCSSGQMVSVNKGDWDTSRSIEEVHEFNKQWLSECKRVLNNDGTIWVSGTYHNIYSIGLALQELTYKILNNITWFKRNAPPNLSCRYFTHSTETVLWAKKTKNSRHYFNYELMKKMNDGKQMRDVWEIPTVKKKEKKYGQYPTQKPIALLERIILASTKEGNLIMDPFNGSGTTGVVAQKLGRKYVGIDLEKDYLDLTIKRLEELG